MIKELNKLSILFFSHQFVELTEEQQELVIKEYKKRRSQDEEFDHWLEELIKKNGVTNY